MANRSRFDEIENQIVRLSYKGVFIGFLNGVNFNMRKAKKIMSTFPKEKRAIFEKGFKYYAEDKLSKRGVIFFEKYL
ncbi:MAG: hypothetical protein Q8L29_00455 [archaeon]|nr:hypothetical protein [archaeon]